MVVTRSDPASVAVLFLSPPHVAGAVVFNHDRPRGVPRGRSLPKGGHPMSAVPVPHTCADPGGWQAGFLSVLPAVRTHAKVRFRRLPRDRREEAVQEAIASACASYWLLAA